MAILSDIITPTNVLTATNTQTVTNKTFSTGTSFSASFSVTGTGYSPNITLTDAATVAWNTALGQVATFTFVSTNRTVGAPTNLVNGGFYALAVIQNAGSNTLTWNSVFKWASGVAPERVTYKTNANQTEIIGYTIDGLDTPSMGVGSLVVFNGLDEGFLSRAGRTIRAAVALENASEAFAKDISPAN